MEDSTTKAAIQSQQVQSDAENSLQSRDVVSFGEQDSDDPYNWSTMRKLLVAAVYCLGTTNSMLSSSLPAGTNAYIRESFSITDPILSALVSTVFLVGYVVGPLIFTPMSERYGRKVVINMSFIVFTAASIGCALAPSFGLLLMFRAIAGVGGGPPISLIGGVYADIFQIPRTRGIAIATYTIISTVGTTLGPTVFAFIAVGGWRRSFYLTSALGFLTLIFFAMVPETYGPVILRRKAQALRRTGERPTACAPIELNNKKLHHILLLTLSRPVVMLVTEPIVLFSTIYVSLVFAILFLLFQAYPYIFQGIYGMSISHSFLAFIPVTLGTICAMPICLWYDRYLYTAKSRAKPWAFQDEYQRLPLACFAGPLLTVSLFWLGWSSSASIHWIVPMISGFPFGIAINLIFIAYFNYLTDAYTIFCASALAAASCGRSILGALLPLATAKMYDKLGIAWATSLIGFFSLALVPIPFVFIRYRIKK